MTEFAASPLDKIEPAASIPKLLNDKDVLVEFGKAVKRAGLVGEQRNALLLYLSITSRLLDRPISVAVKGHSSGGKSHTVSKVLEFFPDEAVITFTSTSEKALIYRDDDYCHRTLVMYEVTGMREGNEDDLTAYFIRTLLSEGRIDYDVTVRTKDGFTAKRITKEGPTNIVFTTTRTRVHAENETRVLSVSVDDGTLQTKRVIEALADETQHAVDVDDWHELQVWLQESGNRRVTIPFAAELAARVPPLAVRLRRDFGAVLGLIRSHAILHQVHRERDGNDRIVAALEDYAAVRNLIAEIIAEGIGATVDETVRETVLAVQELTRLSPEGVMVSELAKELRIDKSNASRRVRRAADENYIRNLEDKRGRPGRWVIGDPLPESIEVLPDPRGLYTPSGTPATAQHPRGNGEGGAQHATERTAESRAIASGCAVAAVQEGVSTGWCAKCAGEGCGYCGDTGRDPEAI